MLDEKTEAKESKHTLLSSKERQRLFIEAIKADDIDKIKELLHGFQSLARIIEWDKYGQTALLYAALNSQPETVKWLLEKGGSKITERNKYGETALLGAAYNGQLETVKWLLKEGGAKITERDNNGSTALLYAAYNGQLETVKWLLEKGGAKITEQTKNSDTALLLAAHYGHLETVQWLIKEGGAKITERNKDGKTALLQAVKHGHDNLASTLIKDFGADPSHLKRHVIYNQKVSQNSVLRQPETLKKHYLSYFKKQQQEMSKVALKNALDTRIETPDLHQLILKYISIEEQKNLPKKIKKDAATLIQPLRTFCTLSQFISYHHRDLAKQLLKELDQQNPHNILTINRTTHAFLKTHGKTIKGSKFEGILKNIIKQTNYFGKPLTSQIPDAKTSLKKDEKETNTKEPEQLHSDKDKPYAKPDEAKGVIIKFEKFIEQVNKKNLKSLDIGQLSALDFVITSLLEEYREHHFNTEDTALLTLLTTSVNDIHRNIQAAEQGIKESKRDKGTSQGLATSASSASSSFFGKKHVKTDTKVDAEPVGPQTEEGWKSIGNCDL